VWVCWLAIGVFQLIFSADVLSSKQALLEILFLAGFILPVLIVRNEASEIPVGSKFRKPWLIYTGCVAFAAMLPFMNYFTTRFNAGYLDFALQSGFLVLAFYSAWFFRKPAAIDFLAPALVLLVAAVTGRRELLLLVMLTIFVALSVKMPPLKMFGWGLVGAAIFLLVLAPSIVIYRTAVSPDYSWRNIQFSDYKEVVKRMPQRVAQSKRTTAIILEKTDSTGFRGTKLFLKEQRQLLIPRFLQPDKPVFRPGALIYEAFFNKENPRRYAYPASLAGEAWWNFGEAALIVVPLIAFLWSLSVLVWSSRLPTWLGAPLAVAALNTETHLTFLFTTQLRYAVVAAGFSLILFSWKRWKNRV
jgi:hypothetical protein